jgi:two-component system, NarL family, invasion response regulator UvrY
MRLVLRRLFMVDARGNRNIMIAAATTCGQQPCRVLLADVHPVVRRGLKDILQDDLPGLVFGEAGDFFGTLDLVRQQTWNLVILSIHLGDANGLEVLKELRRITPQTPVLIFSFEPEERFEISSLCSGASGYLNKCSSSEQIVRAVRKLLAGGNYVSPGLVGQLVGQLNAPRERNPHETLSERENAILHGLARGKSLKELARELHLSPKTVSTYRSRVCKKLGANTSAGIIRYALQHELVS